MPRAQNGHANASTDKPSRQRDYARLLDDERLRRDGLQLRLDRAEVELNRLLGGHQNAAQIMQLVTRPGDGYAAMVGKAAIMDAKIATYTAGLEEQEAEIARKLTAMPVNPADHSNDLPAEPTNQTEPNGAVKVAA